jgi:hypothetical protein
LDPKQNGVSKAFDKAGEELKKAADPIKEAIERVKNGFKDMENGFKDMGKFIGSIKERFKRIGAGLKDIFEGLFVTEFTGIARGLNRGFKDIFDIKEGGLIHDSLYFLGMYGACGIKYITNFKDCFPHYLVDLLFKIVYSPIKIILFGFYILQINLYPVEKQIWDGLYWVDNKIYINIGFNVLKWPKEIRGKCYDCKRLKTRVVNERARAVHDDFTINIKNDMWAGIDQMNHGAAEFRSAFSKNL